MWLLSINLCLNKLADDSSLKQELGGLCALILNGVEDGAFAGDLTHQACAVVEKILRVLERAGETLDDVLTVLASVCVKERLWSVWLKLPRTKALCASIDELKDAISAGSCNLKTLTDGGGDVAALVGALGGFVLEHLSLTATAAIDRQSADRMAASTDYVRFLLVGYQQVLSGLGSEGGEDKLILLLQTLMPTITKIVAFNGLPSNFLEGKSAETSNALIGKLGASCLVHFAKTASAQFKAVMGRMTEEQRGVIEKAVRGEMGGYGGGGAGNASKDAQGTTSGGLKRLGKTPSLKRFTNP